MELHNTYTVRDGGGSVTAHNAVSANFKNVFLNHAAWAQVFVLTKEDGTRTGALCALQFINDDILKGGSLRAVYAAELVGESGATYKRVSIATQANGEDVSYADITFTGSGDPISVKATIVLDYAYEGDVMLTGGDNALVRRLLGAGEEGTFAVSTGESTYPCCPSLRTATLCGTKETVTPSVTSGSVVFGGTQTATSGCELLLHYNGKAVLRALRSGTYKTKTLSYTIENGSVCLPGYYAGLITSVSVGGVSRMGYEEMKAATHALRVNNDTLALGSGGRVLTDPGEEYLAVMTHTYAEVFEPDPVEGTITSILRVPRTSEAAILCRGGALVLWSPTTFKIYERTNGEYEERSIPLERGLPYVVIREGVRYHVATVRNNVFYRYAIEGTTVTQLETIKVGYNMRFLTGACGDYMVYGSNPFTMRSIDIDRSEEFNSAGLKTTYIGASTTGSHYGIFFGLKGQFVYDFVRGTVTDIESGYLVSGRLMYKSGGKVYLYDAANGLREIAGDFTTTDLTSACIAGGFLFTVEQGIMNSYYLTGKDVVLRFPRSDNGKRCNVTVRCKELSAGTTPIRFTMT